MSQAQQAKPAQQPLRPWFDMLSHLYPPTGVLLVGAGSGSSPWVQHLMANTWPRVTLVEADEATAQRLKAATQNHPGWQVKTEVVGPRSEASTFYRASLPTESGLLAPESLRGLWPNLKTTHQQTSQATTLAELQPDADSTASWLLVDCLPGLPIIQGAAQQLAGVDVIAVRVLLNESAPDANANSNAITAGGATVGQLQLALQALGFRCLAIEASRHPGIGHALFVRDTAAQACQLQRQLSQQTKSHQEEVKELAAQEQQLTQVKAAAEKLAFERQQQIVDLQLQVEACERVKSATDGLFRSTAAMPAQWATFASTMSARFDEAESTLTQLSQQLAPDKLLEILLPRLSEKILDLGATQKNQLKDVEARLRTELGKGIGNAVMQIEAFISIQNYLTTGDSISGFHGWPISADLGLFLLDRMRDEHYDLIIEFGSGTSTALFSSATKRLAQRSELKQTAQTPSAAPLTPSIISFEHDAHYYGKTLQMLKARGLDENVQLVHAPLVDWCDGDNHYLYYDCQPRLTELAQQHTKSHLRILLLVDGPPGVTCLNARYPAVPMVFSALGRHHIDVVLDDASRPEEEQVIDLWREFWTKRSFRLSESMTASEKGIYFASNFTSN